MQRLAVDARTMEVSYWRRRPRYQGTADHGRRFKTRLRSEAFHELIRSKLNKRINLLKSAAAHSKWLSESEIVHSPQPRSVSWPPVAYNSKALWRCVTEIERALTLGLPKNAITEFEKFFAQNPPFLGQSLELAVQACLKLDDVPKAKQIQAEASARGYDTSRTEIPLLCYQVRSNNLDATTIQDTVIGWYESGKAKSSGQAHAILVSAVTALLEGESADPMAAINLLLQVHGHPDWSKQYPFHIAVYNVFLAAYARTNHLLGIVWTVQAILEKNLMLTPDFFLCLWQSFGKMRRALQEKGHERRARITNIAYNELVRICRARRLRQEKECFDFGQSLIQTLLYDAPHPGTKAAPRWEGSPGQLEQKQHETRRESKERLRNLRDTWFQDRAASLGLPSARKAVEEMEGDTQDAMRALEQIASRSIPR